MSTISGLGGQARNWETVASRRAEQEAKRFAQLDTNGSGGVDASELSSVLKQAGVDSDGTELLNALDKDGSGEVSSDELQQGLRDLMPPPSSTLDFAQSRLASDSDADGDNDAFAALDTDGDGQLSRAEFEAGRPKETEAQAGMQAGVQGAGGPPPRPPAGGPPPGGGAVSGASSASSSTASSSTSATSSTSAEDPLDTNHDGTVSQLERLAGELKELAKAGGADAANSSGSATRGVNADIAALAQKLYDQISRHWLQPTDGTSDGSSTSGTATSVDLTA
ncbi:EF-hand domain-containing protein [Roseateles sp. BYS87W]|uniref:EF-hand domain-containing protein n=1 Tax=Pelomonas baiyunensis TaxID=3299026 RepID=A0ABW7GYD8_9BURK